MAPRRAKKETLSHALEFLDEHDNILPTRNNFQKRAAEVIKSIKQKREVKNNSISALQVAIDLGYYDICKQLIEEGSTLKAPPLSTTPHPLSFALLKGHYDIARLLIKAGADVRLKFFNCLPMHFALQNSSCTVQIVKDIIAAGFPPNEVIHHPSRRTSLHLAVIQSCTSIVKYLLSIAVDPNVKDKHGVTPLYYAVEKNYPNLVKLLVKNGADINIESRGRFTVIYSAIGVGNCEMVKTLITLGADINYVNGSKEESVTPLQFATDIFRFNMAQLLIEKGADVNKGNPLTGETALHFACGTKHLDIEPNKVMLDRMVELFIKEGADLEARHKTGLTPLQVAIVAKNMSLAKILIMSGANINSYKSPEQGDYNAFHLAAKTFDEDLIKLCLDYGGDYLAQNEDGLSPYSIVMVPFMIVTHSPDCHNSQQQLKTSVSLTVVKLFWKHGFPFDEPQTLKWLEKMLLVFPSKFPTFMKKQNMLFKALKSSNLKIVQKAIAQGAEVKSCTSDIPLPVHYLANKGNKEIIKEFVSRGVIVNFLNKLGETPLHLAVRSGNMDCCKILLEHGAVYNYCDNSKRVKTPLQIAKINGLSEIVKYLAKVDSYFRALKKGNLKKLSLNMKIFHAVMNCRHRDGMTLLGRAIDLNLKEPADQLMKLRLQMSS